MQLTRVVDIRFPRSYGSGYLITNKLVLTANHVAQPNKLASSCEVTPLFMTQHQSSGQLLPNTKSFPAKLIWRSHKIDIALLEIDSPGGVLGLPSIPVRMGRVPYAQGRLRCEGIGFPDAKNSGFQNEDRKLDGNLVWSYRKQYFEVDVENAVPTKPNLWGGYSGTAIFSRGLLVGVVRSYQKAYAGKTLRATPIENCFRERGFSRFLSNVVLDQASVVSPEFGRHVRSHICFVDRDPQVDEVVTTLKSLQGARSKPLIFLVSGEANDDHRRLIERLARENAVQTFLDRYGEPNDVIREIRWPSEPSIDPAIKFHNHLCVELYNALGSWPPGDARYDAKSLRRYINDKRTNIGVWHRISVDRAREGHGDLLRRWLSFWHDHDQLQFNANIIIFLCMVKGEGPLQTSSLFRLRKNRTNKPDKELHSVLERASRLGQLFSLVELGKIEPSHVGGWFDLIREKCSLSDSEELQFLRLRIESEIGTGLRMYNFNRYVTEIMGPLDTL